MNFTDDIPKYRKKSQKKPPAKADHKHTYEPCIIEIPEDWWNKPHERHGKIEWRPYIYSYCPVCGKVGNSNPNWERWWTYEERFNGAIHYKETVSTEEGARELNRMTRTLPTFQSYGIFPKFVNLEDKHV